MDWRRFGARLGILASVSTDRIAENSWGMWPSSLDLPIMVRDTFHSFRAQIIQDVYTLCLGQRQIPPGSNFLMGFQGWLGRPHWTETRWRFGRVRTPRPRPALAYSLALYLQILHLLLFMRTCLHTPLLTTLALTSDQIPCVFSAVRAPVFERIDSRFQTSWLKSLEVGSYHEYLWGPVRIGNHQLKLQTTV